MNVLPPSSPCDACAAPCCRNYHIIITLFDAYRIANTLKMPVTTFAELRWWEGPEEDYNIILSGAPDAAAQYYRLSLKKVPDPDPKYEKRCIFLVTVGDRGRCGVYGVRPDACRVYPTSYNNGVINIFATGGKYCPPGAWRIEDIDADYFRGGHLHRLRQKLIHNFLVDGWNERLLFDREEGSQELFFAFVQNSFRELERRAPEVFQELPGLPPARDEMFALVDGVLRDIGFRTDETVEAARKRAVSETPVKAGPPPARPTIT